MSGHRDPLGSSAFHATGLAAQSPSDELGIWLMYFDTMGLGEHRLWQQLLQRARLGAASFEHRFRLEQRWITTAGTTDFAIRFRYRLLVNVRLGGEASPVFLSTYDEIMISLQADPFDQIRLYGALAYALDRRGSSVQLGYLLNSFAGEHRSRLQVALFLNPDLR